MEVLGIRYVVALCLLAIGFHRPVVNAGHSSTFTLSSPLKDILDFIGKLNGSGIKAKVALKLHQKVQHFLLTNGIPGGNAKDNLDKVVLKIPELRRMLLKDPNNYGKSSYYNPSDDDIDASATVLAYWLPILQSQLFYFYFQTARECSLYGGYMWSYNRFGRSEPTSAIHRWLTDKIHKKAVSYISNGFQPDELHETNNTYYIAANTGIHLYGGGPLSHVQYGLFFLTDTWHHSNLGSAVLFLQEFCEDVQARKFKKYVSTKDYETLIPLCKALSKNLKSLTDIIQPLYRGSTDKNPYKSRLKPDICHYYSNWLRRNLQSIIASLDMMSDESKNWTRAVLYKAESLGALTYGFIFKDPWNGNLLRFKIPNAIRSLTGSGYGSLTKLYEELSKVPASYEEL